MILEKEKSVNKNQGLGNGLEKKVNVGVVQINNSFENQNFLPLSIGYLQTYSQKYLENVDKFNFLLPIYKRVTVNNALEHLSDADMVFFSTYVWNFNISAAIAKKIKETRPNVTTVFGGCHIPEKSTNDYPNGTEDFLRAHPYIDIASTGEGEGAFMEILKRYPKLKSSFVHMNEKEMADYLMERVYNNLDKRTQEQKMKAKMLTYKISGWGDVSSISSLDESGNLVSIPVARKIEDLNDIPSPYLNGFFNELMSKNGQEEWVALFETNRGCPFSCGYCDWGLLGKNKLVDFDLERIFNEIDWISENKIKFITCCDANFGIKKGRDLEIVEKFAENKLKYGYPESVSVQNTKNSSDETYRIQKRMDETGLSKGVLLAFQSLSEKALKATKRQNISLEAYHNLQKRFNADKVATFSDIILGLPEETYESFTEGISILIENGQHNRMQFNNLSILPNTDFGNPDFQKKYGLEIVEGDIINNHGSREELPDNIYEKQKVVVATNAMPRENWVKARSFGYMTALLEFDKLLQIPLALMNSQYDFRYKDIIEKFRETKSESMPIITEINRVFEDQARNIQNGGPEYINSQKWLDIWWPADEHIFIKLATERKLNEFYAESKQILDNTIEERGIKKSKFIQEALILNKELIKLPYQTSNLDMNTSYNIWDVYRANLSGEKVPISDGVYKNFADRTSITWNSWEEWCRKVIWYEHKKGTHIYNCKSTEVIQA